jgi:hypothetical protein
MECPTCGAVAKDLVPGNSDGIVVSCAHCGVYEVGPDIINALLRLSIPERAQALEKAKQLVGNGQRPAITAQCL